MQEQIGASGEIYGRIDAELRGVCRCGGVRFDFERVITTWTNPAIKIYGPSSITDL